MDVTMSSYSFSHQFSQHWTGAPKPVRAAIVQELTDITDLLQTDTPYEDFEFSIHDLDAHLDDLYAAHQVQQAEQQRLADEQAQTERKAREKKQKEEAEQAAKAKEAQAKATREKQAAQLAADKAKNSAATESGDTQKPDNSAATTTSQQEQTTQKADSAHQDNAQHQNPERSDTTDSDTKHADNDEATPITSALSAAIDLSLSDPALTATHKELIQELEATIDDYLTEQMLQMSESLKSWLRTEVSRQLSEQNTANAAATHDEPRPKT